jgi:hypothetical protein
VKVNCATSRMRTPCITLVVMKPVPSFERPND